MTARAAAVNALSRVMDGGYSQLVLDGVLKSGGLSTEDRAFCAALTYGVLDRCITIDYIIRKISAKRASQLESTVANSLRIGIYQLLFMDKIPAFAAINESVNIAKAAAGEAAGGFVNAVLRKAAGFDLSDLPDGRSEYDLSVRYSCTPWIVHRLCTDLGVDKCESTLRRFLSTPDIYARVNTTITTASAVAESINSQLGCDGASIVNERCIKLTGTGNIEQLDAYKNGLFHVQDLSSQACADTVHAAEGMKVLDVCAAPGGKSFTLAENMNGRGSVVACDLHPHRVKLISDGARRLHLDNVTASLNDAAVYNQSLGSFDRVLCDVPCSGLGIIGRKPDIKFKKEAEIASLPQIQSEILNTSVQYCAVGGTVTYSTCTLLRAENNEVFDRFLAEHGNFEPLPIFDGDYCKTFLYETDRTDGFFVAAAKRVR